MTFQSFGPLSQPVLATQKWVEHYMSITGWGLVVYWWNPEGFPEPWEAGKLRYGNEQQAAQAAYDHAKVLDLPYRFDVSPERLGVRT